MAIIRVTPTSSNFGLRCFHCLADGRLLLILSNALAQKCIGYQQRITHQAPSHSPNSTCHLPLLMLREVYKARGITCTSQQSAIPYSAGLAWRQVRQILRFHRRLNCPESSPNFRHLRGSSPSNCSFPCFLVAFGECVPCGWQISNLSVIRLGIDGSPVLRKNRDLHLCWHLPHGEPFLTPQP